MILPIWFWILQPPVIVYLQVREYIDDTEDYVNIQLDNQRNELIQLQLTLTIASFAVAVETLIAGWFGMNIPCTLYHTEGLFWPFVLCMTIGCIMLFLVILGYARWKKLLGSWNPLLCPGLRIVFYTHQTPNLILLQASHTIYIHSKMLLYLPLCKSIWNKLMLREVSHEWISFGETNLEV